MVEGFIEKITSISQQSFTLFEDEYSDVINTLDQAFMVRKAYNGSVGAPESNFLEFQHLKKAFNTWLKQLSAVGFNSGITTVTSWKSI